MKKLLLILPFLIISNANADDNFMAMTKEEGFSESGCTKTIEVKKGSNGSVCEWRTFYCQKEGAGMGWFSTDCRIDQDTKISYTKIE